MIAQPAPASGRPLDTQRCRMALEQRAFVLTLPQLRDPPVHHLAHPHTFGHRLSLGDQHPPGKFPRPGRRDRRRHRMPRGGSGHHGVMAISGAGMTAKMTAAARALESRRPDRLFDDPLAQALAGEDGFWWMEEMRPPGAPAENPSIGPRTWFFDELITRAAGDGLRQVILLAAGMDTRAFRLPLQAGTTLYELDDQAVLKQAILDREHAVPNCTRQLAAADLTGAQWPASLAAAGFNPAAPAVFVAEGLTVYLPEDAVPSHHGQHADCRTTTATGKHVSLVLR